MPRASILLLMPGLILLAYAQSVAPLEPGRTVERSLAGGEKHVYRLAVSADQYLQLVVDQRGIDVVVALLAADGKELLAVDSPTGAEGRETLVHLAAAAGELRIEVRAAEERAGSGRYELRVEALRAATADDRKRAEAEAIMAEADKLLDERDPNRRREAIEKYTAALALWQALDDLRGQARAHSARGDASRLINEREQARASYERALPLWQAVNDPFHQAVTEYNLGFVANGSGEKERAIDHFNRSLPLRRAARDRQGEAITLNALGVVYTEMGENRKALSALEQALELRRAVRDAAGEAVTLNSLALVHRNLGEKRKALDYLQQSLRLRRGRRDHDGEAVTLNSLGVVYLDLGEPQRALDSFALSLPLRRTPATRAQTLNNLGRAYDLLGLPNEALNHYQQALAIFRAAKDKRGEAQTLNYMGLAHWALGDYQPAIEALSQALPLRREVKDKAGEAATLNNLGLVYDRLEERARARAVYLEAHPLFRELSDPQGEAYVLNNLGFASEALGQTAGALEYHRRALELSRKVGDRMREAKSRYGIARIERARGRLNEARKEAEATIKIVDALRAKLTSPELRAAYRASVQQYYDLYIDLLMRLGRRRPGSGFTALALQASERARARSLIELLAESGAEIRSGVDPELFARERELLERINDKTAEQIRLLSGKHRAEQAAGIASEIAALNAQNRQLQDEIRQRSPRYAALVQPEPLTLDEIRSQALDPGTLLLEYALGEERSYLWILSRESLRSYTLPKRAVIEDLARHYYGLLTARNERPASEGERRIAAADAESVRVGAALSRILLQPAASQLRRQRLIIVADGALAYVPFAALPKPGSARPLIVSHEVVSLPSASTLAVLRREAAGRPAASKQIAVIADPVFEADDERIKTVGIKPDAKTEAPGELTRLLVTKSAKSAKAAGDGLRIPRLPYTREEASAILGLESSSAATSAFDFAASRALALSDRLGEHRIVHFATHGFLNSINPEHSGLLLSLVDEKGAPQNGFLLAPEIYNLKLASTELVVLSACQTGLGKEVRGEGLVGLVRGFMYAGAPRVVFSLWNVSDQATAELMKRFYREMLDSKTRTPAALRAAQVALLREERWRAPYYWAAFGLQGETR